MGVFMMVYNVVNLLHNLHQKMVLLKAIKYMKVSQIWLECHTNTYGSQFYMSDDEFVH
jgi:hypothetical protein